MVARNTATRDRHRRQIAKGEPPCGICGEDIDYTLPHHDRREYVVDHIVPLSRGGADTLDNKQPAHRDCNERKAAKTSDELATTTGPRTFVTHRNWTTGVAGVPHTRAKTPPPA